MSYIKLYSVLLVAFTLVIILSLGYEEFGYNMGGLPNILTTLLECVALSYIILHIRDLKTVNRMVLIVMLWTLWVMVVNVVSTNMPLYISFRETLFWPLNFLFFYLLFLEKNEKKDIFIRKTYVITMIFSLILFFFISRYRTLSISTMIESFIAPVNYIYYPLLTLPWILMIKNNKFKSILLIFLFLGVLLSTKRSAVIVCFVCLFFFIIRYYLSSSRVLKIQRYLISVVLILIVFFCFSNYSLLKNSYLFSRFETMKEDGGSGRDVIWENVLQSYQRLSIEQQILGNGHNSVKNNNLVLGRSLSAHNDFLEVLYDYGIIGFIIYLVFYIYILKRLYFLYRERSEFFFPYLTSCIIMIVFSLVSHLILYPTYFLYVVTFWGYIESKVKKSNI